MQKGVCLFQCVSRNILSAADAAAMGGWEECECECECVCFDSLQRKLDTCGITWDKEDSWLLMFGDMSNDIINTNRVIKATKAQSTSQGHCKVKTNTRYMSNWQSTTRPVKTILVGGD